MVKTESKPADIIYSEMLRHTPATIAPLSYGTTLWLNRTTDSVSTQLLI